MTETLVQAKLYEFILPPPKKDDDEAQWVDRLLLVMRYLDAPQRKALLYTTRLHNS